MKISTNWIKDYVDIDTDLKELALQITKSGVNVESLESNYIYNLKIGQIKAISNHPDSDHLHVCQVDVGEYTTQIVCGASNVRENLKVIVALDGAILPGNFVIKKSIIRGIESNGMICALFELGLEDKEANYDKGICELDDKAIVGMDAMEYLGLNDTIYTLDLNPNRNDCLSHLGFAYEVAAVTGKKVKMPDITTNPINESINDYFKLNISTDNCLLYNAKMVKDIVIGESPEFIKQRLISAGMRSINNVVDISNYIMLEYGQPLHFFDKDKLGDNILVRMANDNEEIITLDNKKRILSKEDIVITDGVNPVCIAGVMGGLNTEVDSNTKNILIESAIFNSYNTRYTSLNLNLRSEASLRYEKKLNPEYSFLAIERACHLLEKYASGKVLKDTIINNREDKERQASVSLEKINSLLGMNLSLEDVIKSLDNLDFKYTLKDKLFEVIIPNRRMDVEENSADLIEEIGRLYGFEKIESILPIGETKSGKYIGNVKLRKAISKRLRSLGLNEVRTYTLISEEENNLFKYNREKAIELLKPLSSDKKIIRQTIIPSLLKVNDFNKAHGGNDILIYEISNTYFNEMEEDTKISALIKGNYISNNWHNIKVKVDFYLLKGIIEDLLDYLGFKNRYSFEIKKFDFLHPGVSASILLDREEIGFIGEVHPSLTKEKIYVFEISMNKLNKTVKPIKHKEISKYPTITKDVSFIVNDDLSSQTITDVINKSGGRLLIDVKVFDVYVSDSKSIAYSLTFSDSTKTLTDEEVNTLFEKIMNDVTTKLNCKVKSI